MTGNEFEVTEVGGLRVCRCKKGVCVNTAVLPKARFVAKNNGDNWHEVIREGKVIYNDLCELGERRTGD